MKLRNPFKPFVIMQRNAPYLYRWYIIPKNRFFNIYLHKFVQSDEDRALHDHPWWSLGMILRGQYIEHMPADPIAWGMCNDRRTVSVVRKAWQPVLRRANHVHRVELYMIYEGSPFEWPLKITGYEPVWTLFITGPKIREWGFWCPRGFRHWREFLSVYDNHNEPGRGCE